MSRKKILVIGSASMDLSMNMYKIPERGETIIDDGGVAYTPGGKGANAAVAISKLGADAVLCAKLGADLHGQKLYNFYKDMGIDTSSVKVDRERPTGLAVVMKEGDGENRIVVYPGANSHIGADAIEEAFECSPDAVYLGFEIPFETALAAARIASERNIPIFVDAAPASREHELEALPEIEVFTPNESEILEYTGIAPTTMESCLRASLALYRRVKCKYIVIKLGSRGAFIYDGKRYSQSPAFRAGATVDTTAAGDAFGAALVIEYLYNGGDIKSATKYACAAGAIAVSRYGASSAMPTADEVDYLISNALM